MIMNGVQLTECAMVPTPTEARLIRELNQYCVLLGYGSTGSTGYNVYIWRAALRTFAFIGRRSTCHGADNLIRTHIRHRLRRRAKYTAPPVLRLCFTCGIRRARERYENCAKCAKCFTKWPNIQI